jgi:hypothetical protein
MPDTRETFVFSTIVRNAPEDAVEWAVGATPARATSPRPETDDAGCVIEVREMPADWWDTSQEDASC